MKTGSSIKTKYILPFLCITTLFSLSANAEYRAYLYLLKTKDYINKVTSSYDPVTYEAYHGGAINTEVTLLKTWMCPGYTGGFRAICDPPEVKLLQQLSKNNTKEN